MMLTDPFKKFSRARVIANYRSAFPDPLFLKAGERVQVGKPDEEWPTWLWCTGRNGKSGWVPKEYLLLAGDQASLNRDYNAVELTVFEGDELLIEKIESDWAWCSGPDGRKGWVPMKCLSILEG